LKRKIAAILAADIAGYSRLVAEDEEETLRRLAVYRGVFEDFVARANGRIFNTAGDGFLAEFPSAVDAVRCAIDIQESIRNRNAAYPASRQMAFRMGLTIGDVVDRDGDLLGDGVNIAARLQTLADPGRICISKSVYDSVANKLSVQFTDLGPQQVKNIPNPVHVFSVATGETTAPQKTAPAIEKSKSRPFGAFPSAVAIVLAVVAGASVAILTTGILKPSKKEVSSSDASSKPVASAPVAVDETHKSSSGSDSGSAKKAATEKPATTPAPKPTAVANAEPTQSPPSNDDIASLQRLQPRWWSECKGDDTAAAISACRRLIGSGGIQGSDLAEAHEKLAFAQRRDGQIDDAISSFTTSIGIAETTAAYNERGTAYFLKGQVNDAITDYDRAIALDPSNGDAFNNRAWANYKLGHMSEAKADVDKAQGLIPGKADVWDTRGHILEALGDRAGAIKSFEKALAIDPTLQSSDAGLKRLGAR
jgi:class 3 adenylate cyclase/predicted negative regulator of RcsB-dependent stress response